MSKAIKVLKEQISVSKQTLVELREKFEEIDNQPDGPAQHRAYGEVCGAIGMEQINLNNLEKLLKKQTEGNENE